MSKQPFVEVDGVLRPAMNSEGRMIHPTPQGVINFWKWFKNSQVTDDQGRPLVVYHGTNQPVRDFSRGRLGASTSTPAAQIGFFLTASKEEADQYAQLSADRQITDSVGHEKRMQKMLADIAAAERRRDFDRAEALTIQMEALDLGALREESHGHNVLPVYLRIENPHVGVFKGKPVCQGDIMRAAEAARAGGHDGLFLDGISDAPITPIPDGTLQFVVFKPTQIKSALGNSGKFSARGAMTNPRRRR